MPALPTATTDFLTAIKDALRVRSALGSDVQGAAQNYLRAQDMATVLELLQDGLVDGATLEATGGSVNTLVDTGAFTVGAMVGQTVTFAGDVTAALAGVSAVVVSNTTATLTFATTLPAPPVAGDDYVISATMVSANILNLRDGSTSRAAAPTGNVFGLSRNVTSALQKMAETLAVTLTEYENVVNAGTLGTSTTTVAVLDLRGATVPGDYWVGMKLRRSGQTDRRIVSSVGVNVTVTPAYSVAASGAYTVVRPLDGQGSPLQAKDTHPGAQSGANDRLAEFIEVIETAVVAYTIPT